MEKGQYRDYSIHYGTRNMVVFHLFKYCDEGNEQHINVYSLRHYTSFKFCHDFVGHRFRRSNSCSTSCIHKLVNLTFWWPLLTVANVPAFHYDRNLESEEDYQTIRIISKDFLPILSEMTPSWAHLQPRLDGLV